MEEVNPLDPFALEIGRLCICWAELEFVVQHLFIAVAAPSHFSPALHAIASCLDFRDKLAAVKVGSVAAGTFGTAWCEAVIEELNYVDNTLRPLRNRYVHDYWWPDADGAVHRTTLSSKLHRPQARQPWAVKLPPIYREDLQLITAARIEISTRCGWLGELFSWQEQRRRPSLKRLLSTRPPPLPPPSQPEMPRR